MRIRCIRIITTSITLTAACASAGALSIAPGDIMVYQNRNDIAGGVNATPISILEINPTTPALVQTFPISTQSNPLFSTTTDPIANLSLSASGTQLAFPGWTAKGTTSPLGTSQNIPRGVGTLDPSGNYAQPASYNPSALSTPVDQPHAAYSPDGGNWYFGDTSGMYYNNGTSPLINSDATLSIKGFGGNTYALHTLPSAFLSPNGDTDRNTSATVISKVTPADPGPTLTTITYSPVITLPAAAHDFVMISSFNQAPDTIYVTTSTGISKFSGSGSTWTPEGSLALTGATSITAHDIQGSGVQLFVTLDPGTPAQNLPSTLVEITDSFPGSTPATLNPSTPAVLYTAPSFDVLEGVAFAPVPEPTTALLLLPVAFTLTRRRSTSPRKKS